MDWVTILTTYVLPILAPLVLQALHNRSGGNFPILSALLTALGVPALPLNPPEPVKPSPTPVLGDGHLLKLLEDILLKLNAPKVP